MADLTIDGTMGESFYPQNGKRRQDIGNRIGTTFFKFDPAGPTIEAVVKYRGRDKQQGYLRFEGDSAETILRDCRTAIERGPGLDHLEEPDQGMKHVFWDLVIERPEVKDSLESILGGSEELQRNVLIEMLHDDAEPSIGFTINSAETAEQLVRAMISAERSVALRRNSLDAECDMELKAASQATKIAYVKDSERRVSERIDERLEDQRRTAYTNLQDAIANLNRLQTSPEAVGDVTSQMFSELYPELRMGIDTEGEPPDADESSGSDDDSVADNKIKIDTSPEKNKSDRTALPSGQSLLAAALIVIILMAVGVGGLLGAGVLPEASPSDPGQPTLTADQSGPNQLGVSAVGFEPGNYSVVATSENAQYEVNNVRIGDAGGTILITDVEPGSYNVRLLNVSGGTAGSTNVSVGGENVSSEAISVGVSPPGTVVFDLNETNTTDYSYIITPTDGSGSVLRGNFTSPNGDGTRNITIDDPTPGKEYNVRVNVTGTGEMVVDTKIQLPETTTSTVEPIVMIPEDPTDTEIGNNVERIFAK
ncbi:hypothetical protein EKH57_00525 (plasmid) [Halorubrum sp. BOL3-1]|uniref:fimbrillin family protein n=1 Tax=Halorubrum sp. BOL3-1 TaxID=2497325 RepID=UPI0010050D12|nr:hypothetical protein [Halorubrum sp. BOL3-1]QAU11392.1 hypothetical protein EKH57_00525 [Halorubrum sp. BOL3-1]